MFTGKTISPLYTDMYQLTMGQAYFLKHRHRHSSCFDYFFRKLPFDGGYLVFVGLETLLSALEAFRFTNKDIDFLHQLNFNPDYLDYLKSFKFKGNIYGMNEGEIAFPHEPVLRIEGDMLETQLIETLLLNLLNFQSLIATKAARIRETAGKRTLSDFGLRRAQGLGGFHASRAAIIGGFDNTSNVLAARELGVHAAGTMGHSFVVSYQNELEAFRAYAEVFPEHCVLLTDTFDTLKSGVPNAIRIAKELEQRGQRLAGVRLDSGDLAYLSKKTRQMLDQAGLGYVNIVVSNQLDEYVIKSLLDQGAPIDVFGVGTNMIIGRPDGAIDGVYKLAWSNEEPRLKLSENLKKVTLPGKKKVLRYVDDHHSFVADCICLADEVAPDSMTHPFHKEKTISLCAKQHESLFVAHMEQGKIINHLPTLVEIKDRVRERLHQLPGEHKRFNYPHIYKVGVSPKLMKLKDQIIQSYQS